MSETRMSRRALGRTLTRLSTASVAESLDLGPQEASSRNGAARVGFTGAPGAGKSTLISRFAKRRLDHCRNMGGIAVLAVDPTSPISHGAILGDRIRMDAVAGEPELFIRSLSSRSSSDGLADNLVDLLAALNGQGFREILLETVGVGQAEHAIRYLTDTVVMVLQPDSGDVIQAMKAGILEVADIYVVNKADLPGARQTVAEIRAIAKRITKDLGDWQPPVIEVAYNGQEGINALDEAVSRHLNCVVQRRDSSAVQHQRRRYHLQSLVARRVGELLDAQPERLECSDMRGLYNELVRALAADATDASG